MGCFGQLWLKIAAFCFFILLPSAVVHYNGHKVIRVQVPNATVLQTLLHKINDKNYEVDFWQVPGIFPGFADLHISNSTYGQLVSEFEETKLPCTVLIDDIEQLVQTTNNEMEQMQNATNHPADSLNVVGKYARYDEIQSWLNSIVNSNPDILSLTNIGSSFEGRTLSVLKIGAAGPDKPAMWVDGGIHAREWISPSSVIFFIDQLVQRWNNRHPTCRNLLQNMDFYVLPIHNPDGYEYSHTDERLWRKSRGPTTTTGQGSGNACVGTDLNRNWPFQWGKAGSSNNPCSNIYKGPTAGSEPETKAVIGFILSNKERIKAFLTTHSYTQVWFTRWGYTRKNSPYQRQTCDVIGKAAMAASKVYGARYDFGTAPRKLYAYSGGSPDWARGVAGIKHSYAVELRDRGRYGFLLPPRFIIPTGKELTAGVLVIAKRVVEEYRLNIANTSTLPTELQPQRFLQNAISRLRCKIPFIG